MFDFLTSPNYPNAAIGIEQHSLTALSLQRSGRQFGIRQAATIQIPSGVVTPDFLEPNIVDVHSFVAALEEAVTGAGLLGQKRWSISLPGNAARTAILTLDTEPASKQESSEILDWKAEQTFGAPSADLRISQQRISPDAEGRSRFFATAIRLAAIDEYETIFERFGWKAGLIMPRAISEAAWLANDRAGADSLLLSSQSDGFTALLLRGGEPAVVRSVTCLPTEADDEIYRLLMFYNDRFGSMPNGVLDKILVVGSDLLPATVTKIASEAFGRAVNVLRPADIGLDLGASGLSFDSVAAPAGLASLA